MPMTPDEVAELSRLLDEALALEPQQREPWLADLEQANPQVAHCLREMLRQAESSEIGGLPKLQPIDAHDAGARPAERVGPYVLVREIGRGGMGSVWLAERADGAYKRRVALKLPRLAWTTSLGKRMARERDIGALLEHPNIARLYDAGVDEHGRPYIAMEYIDGQPIDVYCCDHALDVRARLKLFVEVAQAVAYAHGRLVLHRDLKPANVLVDAGGHVHLLDFGIAKLLDEAGATGTQLTQEQGRVLTLNYAAPEQITGRPLGVTADVYALGVMLHELLTGTLPYTLKRNTTGAMEEAILAGDAPSASSRVADKRLARGLRGDLDAILAKAIKRDPNERYPTADALAGDIQRYLDGHAIEARPDSAWYRLRKAVIRHKVPVMAASAVLVVALVGVTTTLMQGRRTADEAERARLATAFVSELFRVNANQEVPLRDGAARASPAVFVDRGAPLIEARFQRQPELQAELYGAVGKVYLDLGAVRLATEYAMRQLTSLRAQKASGSRIGQSLMLLSSVALTAERDADAEDYALQAVAALPENDAMTPKALLILANAQARNGKVRDAERSRTEAKRLLGVRDQAHSLMGAWLMYTDGYLLLGENRFDEAMPLFLAAIAMAEEVEGLQSDAAAGFRLHLASELISRNRSEEGRWHGDAALAVLEAEGEIGRIRAARERAQLQQDQFSERQAGYAETIAVLDDSSTFLRTRASSIPAEILAEVDYYKGRVYSYWGEFERCKTLLESAAGVLLKSTQSFIWQMRFAGMRGACAMYLGEHEIADGFFREALEVDSKMGRIDHPYAAYDWANLALNLNMQDRHREAEAVLLKAPAYSDEQGNPLSEYGRLIPQTRTRVRLDAGDIKGARQSLPATDPPREDPWDTSSYYQLRGEIACASGDLTAGLADLTRSLKSQSVFHGPNHPSLARLRAVAGLCAMANGDRKQAEEFASEAQRAFIAQPNVSPYFKEPLSRLERQLRPKST